ncbi:MAG: hypothetical protein Q8J84_09830 [Flavobacteriaceae bacterium]|nr:hypothetical protein [Flavobacteriaceae bacterium]
MAGINYKKKKKSPSPREGFRMGIAAILALFIGGISVIAGSKVLLGFDVKNYIVLNWLVIYNVILGIISMMAAYLIWKNNLNTKKVVTLILASHILIATHLYFFSETAVLESIKAMSFRISIWIVICLLTYKN